MKHQPTAYLVVNYAGISVQIVLMKGLGRPVIIQTSLITMHSNQKPMLRILLPIKIRIQTQLFRQRYSESDLHVIIISDLWQPCCCCLPCNHCSNRHGLLKKFWPFLVIGCVLRTAGSSFMWNYADPLTSLELLNYYITLAMSSSRFAYYAIPRNGTTNDCIFHI